jgi:DNA mismatch repair protein MutL
MGDIIQLLPDAVANQIAAGEVIQRPSSAVKELLENSVDAGSKRIELFIKDSGKTLIQIVDDGSGMSTTDARMAFERHATSKIRNASDLFTIRTMGFRGEALASIAAIAHVEMKTRRQNEEIGTTLEIEGNEVKKQQPSGIPTGTTISIKNLFYNVPARRNFLKSNTVEAKHIIDEFERVAYAQPDIYFSLHQNGLEIFRLPISNLRQRIININGANYNERLVPVNESTSLLNISGFIGKPEFAKKTRGEQFFFVNKRFIKDGYLHHAVTTAFEELLSKDSYASYWLYLDIDPARIDVNIHPTKTEIKFEDERSVYAIVRASVKRALGQYSISPSLDFEREKSFDVPHEMRYQAVAHPGITINTGFNPFENREKSIASSGSSKNQQEIIGSTIPNDSPYLGFHHTAHSEIKNDIVFQFGTFIISKQQEGILVVNTAQARERIYYERYINQLNSGEIVSQQSLFPVSITLSSSDYELMKELNPSIRNLGFDLQEFGPHTFAIHGIPNGIDQGKEKDILESLLEQYKHNSNSLSTGFKENIARSMAKSVTSRKNAVLSESEMKSILIEIRTLEKGSHGLDGKPCMILLKTTDIAQLFKQ